MGRESNGTEVLFLEQAPLLLQHEPHLVHSRIAILHITWSYKPLICSRLNSKASVVYRSVDSGSARGSSGCSKHLPIGTAALLRLAKTCGTEFPSNPRVTALCNLGPGA